MIRPKLEKKDNYIQLSFIGIGHHGFDVNEKGEGVMRINVDRELVKKTRNECDRFLSHDYGD